MKLIINADDFGLSKSITDGIVKGIVGGYITSTTIMVNMKYAKYAINQAIKNNINCVGLHVNLTVGKPILPNKHLTDELGIFLYNKNQIENSLLTYDDAYNEIMAQIKKFNEYSKGKLKLDHIDCHHLILKNIHIRNAVFDIAKQYNLPLRNEAGFSVPKKELYGQLKTPDFLEYDFTIDNVSIEKLTSIIKKYKNKNVSVEIMSHPGNIDDYTKTITSYLGRAIELETLKQAKDIGLFNEVKLLSFSNL